MYLRWDYLVIKAKFLFHILIQYVGRYVYCRVKMRPTPMTRKLRNSKFTGTFCARTVATSCFGSTVSLLWICAFSKFARQCQKFMFFFSNLYNDISNRFILYTPHILLCIQVRRMDESFTTSYWSYNRIYWFSFIWIFCKVYIWLDKNVFLPDT